MRSRVSAVVVLAAGAVLLGGVWLLSAVPAPPLYDGLGLPPEPYRYLNPPPRSHQAGPPTSVTRTLTLTSTGSPFFVLQTAEQPPQAQLHLDENAIVSPRGPQKLTLSLKPVPPPSDAPSDGIIAGNVYRLSAVAQSGQPARFNPQGATVDLRGVGPAKRPAIEEYANGQWTRLSTGQFLGTLIYSAEIRTTGDFALVVAGAAATSSSFLPLIIVAAVVLILAVLVLVVVRLARGRSPQDGASGDTPVQR